MNALRFPTAQMREAVRHQTSRWLLRRVLGDREHFQALGLTGCRTLAVARAELQRRRVPVNVEAK